MVANVAPHFSETLDLSSSVVRPQRVTLVDCGERRSESVAIKAIRLTGPLSVHDPGLCPREAEFRRRGCHRERPGTTVENGTHPEHDELTHAPIPGLRLGLLGRLLIIAHAGMQPDGTDRCDCYRRTGALAAVARMGTVGEVTELIGPPWTREPCEPGGARSVSVATTVATLWACSRARRAPGREPAARCPWAWSLCDQDVLRLRLVVVFLPLDEDAPDHSALIATPDVPRPYLREVPQWVAKPA